MTWGVRFVELGRDGSDVLSMPCIDMRLLIVIRSNCGLKGGGLVVPVKLSIPEFERCPCTAAAFITSFC
jgi:hypothetical protein